MHVCACADFFYDRRQDDSLINHLPTHLPTYLPTYLPTHLPEENSPSLYMKQHPI